MCSHAITKFMMLNPTFVHGMLSLTVISFHKILRSDMVTLHDQVLVR